LKRKGTSVFGNLKMKKKIKYRKVYKKGGPSRVKRIGPKITKATAMKIVKSPKTPPQLKKYWRKRFNLK